jgi:hypothetical protein
MNAEERQALRERHVEQYGLCVYCFAPDPDAFSEFMPVVYPCDTIKVLDWAEQAYNDGWKACDFQWREL